MDKDVYQLFIETLKKYGNDALSIAIFQGIKFSDFSYFTRTNNARFNFLDACEETSKNGAYSPKGTHRLLKNYVKLAVQTMLSGSPEYDKFNTNTALNYAILSTYKDQLKRLKSSQKALYRTTKILEALVKKGENNFTPTPAGKTSAYAEINNMLRAIDKNGFTPTDYFSNLMATQFTSYIALEQEKALKGPKKAKQYLEDTAKNTRIYVKKLYERTFGKFKSKVLSGKTNELQSCDSIGRTLYVAQSKGQRETQEDSCLICKSKKQSGLSFMAVCDGMGGYESGELASQMTIDELKKWFEANEQVLSTIKTEGQIASLLNSKLREISINIFQKIGNNSGCTCVCAIANKNGTFISNIGDSRAYIITNKGKDVTQITEDQSYVKRYYAPDHPEVANDDLRFHNRANEITQALGLDPANYSLRPKTYVLPPHSYEKLLLCSDGVSDLVGLEEILAINKASKPSMFAQKLVQYALTHNAHLPQYLAGIPHFVSIIPKAKDNATAAVLIDKGGK